MAGKPVQIVEDRLLALMGKQHDERLAARFHVVEVEQRTGRPVHRADIAVGIEDNDTVGG
eukprot:gene1462-1693_t